MLQLQYLRWSEHRTATRPQGHCQKPPATQVWTLKECMLICQASPLSLRPNLHPPHHHVGSLLHNPSAVAACHLHPLLSPCLSFSLFPHNANHLCSKCLEKLHRQTHPPLLKNRFHTNLSICNHVHVLIEGQPCTSHSFPGFCSAPTENFVKKRKQTADGILILPHLTYLHGILKIAKPNLGDGKKKLSHSNLRWGSEDLKPSNHLRRIQKLLLIELPQKRFTSNTSLSSHLRALCSLNWGRDHKWQQQPKKIHRQEMLGDYDWLQKASEKNYQARCHKFGLSNPCVHHHPSLCKNLTWFVQTCLRSKLIQLNSES